MSEQELEEGEACRRQFHGGLRLLSERGGGLRRPVWSRRHAGQEVGRRLWWRRGPHAYDVWGRLGHRDARGTRLRPDGGQRPRGKSACYKVVQELLAKSKAENGSLICAEILGLKGHEKAISHYEASPRTSEYYKTRPCAAKVESAARIFAGYLRDKQRTCNG